MKKLKYLFCFLFVLFALGSISVFAEEPITDGGFHDFFRVYRFLAYNVPTSDYNFSYSGDLSGQPGHDTYTTWAEYKGSGTPPESYAYSYRVTFLRQNDGYPYGDEFFLPPGYVVSGTFNFQLQFVYPNGDDGSIFSPSDLQHAIVMEYDYPDGDFWSISGRKKLSDIKFINSEYIEGVGTVWNCRTDFYYYNDTNEYIDMRKHSFQFMYRFKSSFAFPCIERFASYDAFLSNFFYGKGDTPSAPAFKDYNVYNDIITEEDSLVNDAVGGYTDATEKFEEFVDILDPEKETSAFFIFGSSMLFITALFEHLLSRINLLESVLYVSIFFGLCGFFLNILPSMVSNFKHRGDAEKVPKNKKGDSA